MIIRTLSAATMAATVALLLPLAAEAQPTYRSDLEYCWALSDLYVRYVGSDERSTGTLSRRMDVEGRYALSRCQQGDAATAIPILERKLTNNGFRLPLRG